jgi:hypothetical protein
MRALLTTLGAGKATVPALKHGLRLAILTIISTICVTTDATSPMPVDLELSMDVKTEEGKQSVFDVVRARAAAQGFTCKELPTKTFGRDVLVLHCVKSSDYPTGVHSIVASDNLGLALFRIDGYFGGAPEPVSTLVATIENDVKQISEIAVRAMSTRADRSVDSSEAQALREMAKRAMDHWRQMCADKPSHPACPQRK